MLNPTIPKSMIEKAITWNAYTSTFPDQCHAEIPLTKQIAAKRLIEQVTTSVNCVYTN